MKKHRLLEIDMSLKRLLLATVGFAASSLFGGQAMAATSCEELAKLQAPDVTITVTQMVEAPSAILATLPKTASGVPFCRIGGFIAPTKDSHIGFELWLPATATWNHKLQAVGNGGLSGALNYRAMAPGFARGYATLTTDLGHTNTPAGAVEDATWANGHPEKVVDYAYRATHLTTLAAKRIVAAYYGRAADHAYFTGCSAGGIAGMNELLRFPKDFDGYIIGDATPDHLAQEIGALWNTLAASLTTPAEALKPRQIALVHATILKQCTGKDGGIAGDAFLTDPTACKVDVAQLQCVAGQDAAQCLSSAQVAIFNKIYQGPRDPRTDDSILAGLTPGTELGWDKYFAGKTNPVGIERPWAGFLASIVYNDPTYLTGQRYLAFDFDKDYRAMRQQVVAGETLDSSWNARSRDLDAFAAGGGKLIHYHGWDDPNIPALEAVKFHDGVVADQAKRHRLSPAQAEVLTRKFYRLFMIAGMGHCSGGDGPSSFGQNGQRPLAPDAEHDTMLALERWVEQGVAPEQFVAARVDAKTNAADLTRPVCVYPKVPVWEGHGNPNEAASFACATGPKTAVKTAAAAHAKDGL